jgi:hypothetical protein
MLHRHLFFFSLWEKIEMRANPAVFDTTENRMRSKAAPHLIPLPEGAEEEINLG